jgi:hypothetical protein
MDAGPPVGFGARLSLSPCRKALTTAASRSGRDSQASRPRHRLRSPHPLVNKVTHPEHTPMTIIARALAALLLASTSACLAAQEPPPASITVEKGRATVRGVVRENVTRCQVDGPCYLVLNGEPAGVRVYYHHGEDPPCANERSASTGLRITAGDSIEAIGVYSVVNRTHTVDVCCPDCSLAVTHRRQ